MSRDKPKPGIDGRAMSHKRVGKNGELQKKENYQLSSERFSLPRKILPCPQSFTLLMLFRVLFMVFLESNMD
jgi:hypothetical protein